MRLWGFGCGFYELQLGENHVLQREWHQMKIKDYHFPEPGSAKGQEQVLGFSGSHVHLSKARKQRACTMLPKWLE